MNKEMYKEDLKMSKIQVLEKAIGTVDCIGLVLSVNTSDIESTMVKYLSNSEDTREPKLQGIKELDAFIIEPKFKPQSSTEVDMVNCKAIFNLRNVKKEDERSIFVPKNEFNVNNILNVAMSNNITVNNNFRRRFEPLMLGENLELKKPRDKRNNNSIVHNLLYLEIDFMSLMTKFLRADDTTIGELNFAVLSARRSYKSDGFDLTVIKCLRGERGNIVSNKNYENLKFY